MTIRTSDVLYYPSLKAAAEAADLQNEDLVIDSLAKVIQADGELSVTVPVRVELGAQIQVADDRVDLEGVVHPRLTFAGPFTAPPIRIFDRQTGWLGTVVFGARAAVFVTPSWWEDGTTDDTKAVQIALGYSRVRFTRSYWVKSVTAGQEGAAETKYQIIDMAGFYLEGILNAPTGEDGEKVDAVLTLHNWSNGRMFNAGIRSDGNQRQPQYATNYGCALRFSSDVGEDPTQFGYIYGLRIYYMPVGIVWGAYPTVTNPDANLSALPDLTASDLSGLVVDNPAQASTAQSEFHIYDYSMRGVLLPFFGNAENAYLQFHNSIFAAQKFEAATLPSSGTGGWWSNAAGATLVNLTGLIRLTGGSIQRAIAAGYNLVGKGIVVENCDVERACTDYLMGDVTYRSCRNGHYGWPNTVPTPPPVPFRVAADATGRLLLDDVVIRRIDGVASESPHNLVDASKARDYEAVFRDTVVKQWRIGANSASSYLVHGGRAVFGDLTVDNSGSAASYRLREGANRLTTADPTGRAMSSVNDDLSPKGGWVSIGASNGGFYRVTSDLPPDATEAIRLHASVTGVEIVTDKVFAVESGQSRILDFWLKYTGATGSLRADLRWFDANPNPGLISQVVLLSQDRVRLADNGFTNWLRFRAVGKAPNGAVAAKLSFYLGAGADLMITDIRVV